MGGIRLAGTLLIIAGAVALAYGSFTFTKETHEATLGPIELTVKDKETVSVPTWAGVGLIALGGVLLVVGSGRK
jgi:hypothetical protein